MPLETATYISDLATSNPAHTDGLSQADSHMRLLKSTIKATFPNFTAAGLVSTQAQIDAAVQQSLGTATSVIPVGSQAAPGLSVVGDSNTGLWSPAPDQLSVSTGGTVLLAINPGGNGAVNVTTLNSGPVNGSAGSFSSLGVSGTISAGTSISAASAAVSGNAAVGSLSATGNATVTGQVSAGSAAVTNNATVGGNATVSGNANVTGTLTAGTVVGALAAGAVQDFAGLTAPTGWLACDGAAISRSAFPALFAYIGTTWGAGDGSTTFNVPNLQNRFRRHRQFGSLAGEVGTLQAPLNLSHTHAVNGTSVGASAGHTHDTSTATVSTTSTAHTHGVSAIGVGNMSANSSHTHALGSAQSVFLTSINNGTGTNQGNVMVTGGGVTAGITTSSTNTDHTHALSGSTDAMSANGTHSHTLSGSTGANSADHTHSMNFTSGAAGDANEARPYCASLLTCIKLFN